MTITPWTEAYVDAIDVQELTLTNKINKNKKLKYINGNVNDFIYRPEKNKEEISEIVLNDKIVSSWLKLTDRRPDLVMEGKAPYSKDKILETMLEIIDGFGLPAPIEGSKAIYESLKETEYYEINKEDIPEASSKIDKAASSPVDRTMIMK